MFCVLISLATLGLGIGYVATGYHVPVGYVQIILGLLCMALCVVWMVARRKDSAG